MWATRDQYGNSMKWHLADPDSVEIRQVEEGWGKYKKTVDRTFVLLMCGGKKPEPRLGFREYEMQAKVRDTINVYQNNVCSYCRNYMRAQIGEDKALIL